MAEKVKITMKVDMSDYEAAMREAIREAGRRYVKEHTTYTRKVVED